MLVVTGRPNRVRQAGFAKGGDMDSGNGICGGRILVRNKLGDGGPDLIRRLPKAIPRKRLVVSWQTRISPNYSDHLPCMPCPVPRWTEQVLVGFFPIRAAL